jgi:glycolate oxidase FAD binding subunit
VSEAAALAPATREELAGIVAAAARDRTPLFVTGGAGARPPTGRPCRIVSTRALTRVVAHEAGDLTLTAEAGLRVGPAQELLAGARQFVAIAPPEATLGGAIAAGRGGPLAGRFGPVRDQVLGLVVVNGDGRITRCGGRVVKNVTGYDLCRLYAGSGGGLGIVVECTVRLHPLPESAREVACTWDDAAGALGTGLELRRKVPELAAVRILGGAGRPVTLAAVAAGLAEFAEAAAGEVRAAVGSRAVEERACDLRGLGNDAPPAGATAVVIAAPPAAFPALLRAVEPLLSEALRFEHDVLRGVRSSWHAPGEAAFRDEQRLDAVLAAAGAAIDCPGDPDFAASVLQRFPSQRPGGLAVMRALKSALDPAGILNPGRTVYG